MGKNDGCFEEEGWYDGLWLLTVANQTAAYFSYGLPPKEIEKMADYCSLLSHCLRSLAIAERRWRKD